ncbi:hypothetical protein J6590_072327 [Homalodisca vitripennis]|nr:hypothetical protein J6590_072327 [Homalodisca vitripennis]
MATKEVIRVYYFERETDTIMLVLALKVGLQQSSFKRQIPSSHHPKAIWTLLKGSISFKGMEVREIQLGNFVGKTFATLCKTLMRPQKSQHMASDVAKKTRQALVSAKRKLEVEWEYLEEAVI